MVKKENDTNNTTLKETKAKGHKKMFLVSYIGRELLGNSVFDTNIEKIAKENNVFNKERAYKPLIVINGENELLHVVEDEIQKMKEGEEKRIVIAPSHAFGERKNELVKVVPLQVFRDQKINPIPGLVVAIGQSFAKVQSISGGRVRVDFNSPLAGREIEYYVKIEKEIKGNKDIGEKIFEKYFSMVPNAKHSFSGDKTIIELESETMKNLDKVLDGLKTLAKEFDAVIDFKEIKS
ncbi:MAG: FKBP-type peptidyl-prolyl cis-trans isomerase, partial [Candidatus ainarchaeum sp.]|nr:FKBP-type peptidyl-prolyl cis-trans isomerase [Candidatus ainarchaeum sp.]